MQWIANTIGKLLTRDTGAACVMSLTQNDVRQVLEYLLPCGHNGYAVFLEYLLEDDAWVPIGSLRDFNLDAVMELLQRAQTCIKNLSE